MVGRHPGQNSLLRSFCPPPNHKPSEQMDGPALASPLSCASAASQGRGWAPPAKCTSSHASAFHNLPSHPAPLWFGTPHPGPVKPPLTLPTPLLSQAVDEDKRGGEHEGRASPIHLLWTLPLQADFSGSSPWPEHVLCGPCLIKIHRGSVTFQHWGWNIWSQPAGKEVDRGISVLE